MRKKHLPAILAGCLLLWGCASIDVKQDFDFTVTTLPYSSTLKEGTAAEIRCQIVPGEDGYLSDSTRYYVRYFPTAGEGTLRVGRDTALVPNDLYRLPAQQFRLYYLPAWGTSETEHTLALTFTDSWGHTQDLSLQFNQKAQEEDNQ
ncbi:MAG: DUF3872 domain-containing protein [Bacteroides sp.]|nr:DUF3872 domain-containing protein [Bacteroides sp.]MCM1531451.1 DUF3872 domain-containing protein [Ruminococcus flavefaciens]MCM1554387.1 DUF3872 domain-containing protein [Bacteroides sp.]